MKIACSGPHHSGKSTVTARLSTVNKLNLLPEKATELFKEGRVKLNQVCSFEDQFLIMEEQYKQIWENESFITDRCILDSFVYGLVNYLDGAYSYKEFVQLEHLFLKTIHLYDSIYILHPIQSKTVEADGIRDTHKEYQQRVFQQFLNVVKNYKLKNCYFIASGIEEEIFVTIQETL